MKAHTQFLISEEHERITDLIDILKARLSSKQLTVETRKAISSTINYLETKKRKIEARYRQKIVGLN